MGKVFASNVKQATSVQTKQLFQLHVIHRKNIKLYLDKLPALSALLAQNAQLQLILRWHVHQVLMLL